MQDAYKQFQDKINEAQSTFNAIEGNPENKDLFALKDSTFDALSELSTSMADDDLRQLLARTAIDIHLFPVGREGWEQDLIDTIEFGIATGFQTVGYVMETGSGELAAAA